MIGCINFILAINVNMSDNQNKYAPNKTYKATYNNENTFRQYNRQKYNQTIAEMSNTQQQFKQLSPQKNTIKHTSPYALKKVRNRFSIAQKPQILRETSVDQQTTIEQPKKGMFANQYKSNLLKTIYRETHQIIKKKILKQESTKYGIEYFYDVKEDSGKHLRKTKRERNGSFDSFMKATSMKKYESKGPSASQLPLIGQTCRIKQVTKPVASPRTISVIPRENLLKKRDKISKKAEMEGPQKHEINPWQTYHDQFIE